MKRDNKNLRRSELRKKAMELYLLTRDKIRKDHPGLLSSVRDRLVQKNDENPLKIDRNKNIKTIHKMMNISNFSDDFHAKIEKLMTSQNLS